jgi:hypothetical protein
MTCRASIRCLTAAAVLVLCITRSASAQPFATCESYQSRPAVGMAVTLNGVSSRLSYGLLGGDAYNGLRAGSGPGFLAKAEVPATSLFGVQASYARSTLPIGRDLSPGSPSDETVGIGRSVVASELTLGVVRHSRRPARRVCGYAAVKAGLYQMELESYRSRNGGLAGAIGVDVPLSRSVGAFAEIQITAIANRFRPPLGAGAVVIATVDAGLRYRFP